MVDRTKGSGKYFLSQLQVDHLNPSNVVWFDEQEGDDMALSGPVHIRENTCGQIRFDNKSSCLRLDSLSATLTTVRFSS